jgi:hypothetical protein
MERKQDEVKPTCFYEESSHSARLGRQQNATPLPEAALDRKDAKRESKK